MTARLCAHCENTFASRAGLPEWIEVYCSAACKQAAYRARRRNSEVDDSEWDGVTRYSHQKPPTFLYVRHCLQCGRDQDEPERLTRGRARLINTAGLPSCHQCRGWVTLDEVGVGQIGSAQTGHNQQYASMARAWGTG